MEYQVYQTAIYLRLSRDDEGDGESYSISNQRQMLTEFVADREDLTFSAEFVDDGYGGYDFDRPQFRKMMECAKNGKINCIVVKDFSRLGRNFQKTEEYMQRIFPKMGIRFISVMDCYDTGRQLTASERLTAPLINLANEFVVSETSQKIRSVLELKRRNGEFVGNHTVYGYVIKDRHLEVDEEAAEIVRKIFDLKIEGLSNQGIAEYLNSCNVASPLEHRITNGSTAMGRHQKKGDKALWSSASVRRVLENPIYIGTLVQGKTTSVSYRNRKRIRRDPSELTAFENAHEAIISDTVFLIVQDLMNKDGYSNTQRKSYLFSGFAYCGNCGKQLIHRENGSWRCRNTECTCKPTIKETDLSDAVFRTLKTHIDIVLNPEMFPVSEVSENQETVAGKEQQKLESEISRFRKSQEMLPSQKQKGIISQADYEEMMQFYDAKIGRAEHKIEQIQHQNAQLMNCIDEIKDHYRRYAEMSELTRGILVTFIEKIEVFSKTKIRIYFRYADFFKEVQKGGDGNGA